MPSYIKVMPILDFGSGEVTGFYFDSQEGGRPEWRMAIDGSIASDQIYREGGWWPVLDTPPNFSLFQTYTRTLEVQEPLNMEVQAVYTPTDRTVEEVITLMCARVDYIRDQRIEGGFLHTVNGQEYAFQSRQNDRENISNLKEDARAAIDNGIQADDLNWNDPAEEFMFITANNQLVPMDAFEMVALYDRGKQFKTAQTRHAFGLKQLVRATSSAQNPIFELQQLATVLDQNWPT